MKKRVKVFACLFPHREIRLQSHQLLRVRLQEGPLQPLAEGRAASVHREAALGVWKSGSRPHKNAQTVLYTIPLSREAGRGVAGDHQAFPPAMAQLEPQQSQGDLLFPSPHPGCLIAGGNTRTLFPQACSVCLVFILLSPAAFLVDVL